MSQTNKCCGEVPIPHSFGRYAKCLKTATVVRNGQHFCAAHDPIRIEERRKQAEIEFQRRRSEDRYKYLATRACKGALLSEVLLDSGVVTEAFLIVQSAAEGKDVKTRARALQELYEKHSLRLPS